MTPALDRYHELTKILADLRHDEAEHKVAEMMIRHEAYLNSEETSFNARSYDASTACHIHTAALIRLSADISIVLDELRFLDHFLKAPDNPDKAS